MNDQQTNNFSWYFLHPKFMPTWISIIFLFILSFIPTRVKDYLASVLSKLLVHMIKKPTNIIKINLTRCFPDKNNADIHKLTQECAERFIITFLAQGEFLFRSWKHIEARVQFIGFDEHVQKALNNNQKILFLMPHFWGMEYAAVRLSKEVPIHVMMKEYPNPIYTWLSYKLRTRYQAKMFTRDQGLHKLLSGWKQGKHVAYSPDEDHGLDVSEVVPFFGTEKATLPILSRITRSSKAVMIPCSIGYNKKKSCFEFRFSKVITLENKLPRTEDARLLNQIVEEMIQQYTPDYSWVLKIFRSQKIYKQLG